MSKGPPLKAPRRYGDLVLVGAADLVCVSVPVLASVRVAVGCVGSTGSTFAAPEGAFGAAVVTGAGGAVNVWSRIELGAERRDDVSDSTKAMPIKIPPHHQLSFVRRFPAWRVPMMESAELLAPPKLAASPPPLPA